MKEYTKYNDSALLELFKESSPVCDQAFDVIFNKYSTSLNAYCIYKSATREDAEEIFSDTWMKFIERAKTGLDLDNILPYLITIARNLAINRYRQQNASKTINIDYKDLDDLDLVSEPVQLQNQIESEELISLVKIAVNSLDDIYKEAFVMQWFGGLTHKEIGEIQGITPANAKTRCHRAMNEVIRILKPYYVDNNKI